MKRKESFDPSADLLTRGTDIVRAIRQNHALEHATIAVLLRRLDGRVRMMGRTGWNGFYIIGNIPTHVIEEAAQEALHRLQSGERDLAISPMCGTNIVVAGLAAGVASMFAARGHRGMDRLGRILVASVVAVLVAQPLGKLAQEYITTTADLDDVRLGRVKRSADMGVICHKIELIRFRC